MQLHKLLKTSGKCGQGAKFQGKLKRKHTQTHTNTEDACAACGAANVGGKFAYTAASQEENFVVFGGTIWLHQRSQRIRRKAGKAKGEWGNAKPENSDDSFN